MNLVHLTFAQKEEKDRLEKIVSAGIATFKEVGDALAEIWALKLYLDEYATFEDYCREKWKIGTRRAYQIVNAAKVVDNVRTTVQIPNEAVARELSPLPKSQQVSAAQILARGEKVTATAARAAANQVRKDWDSKPPATYQRIPLSFEKKVLEKFELFVASFPPDAGNRVREIIRASLTREPEEKEKGPRHPSKVNAAQN